MIWPAGQMLQLLTHYHAFQVKRQIDGFVSMYYKGIMVVCKTFSPCFFLIVLNICDLSFLIYAKTFSCTFCLQQCEDESCKHTTRSPNFRLLGERERGTVCPNYPNCNGTLLRKVYTIINLITPISLLLHRLTLDFTVH